MFFIKHKSEQLKVSWHHLQDGKKRYTLCNIKDKDGKVVAEGKTTVHKGDAYNKTIGRDMSYIRAVRDLTDDKVRRIAHYKAYSSWNTKKPRLAWITK